MTCCKRSFGETTALLAVARGSPMCLPSTDSVNADKLKSGDEYAHRLHPVLTAWFDYHLQHMTMPL